MPPLHWVRAVSFLSNSINSNSYHYLLAVAGGHRERRQTLSDAQRRKRKNGIVAIVAFGSEL